MQLDDTRIRLFRRTRMGQSKEGEGSACSFIQKVPGMHMIVYKLHDLLCYLVFCKSLSHR